MPMPFFSEKSPTLVSVNWCLILSQEAMIGNDSRVASLSHKLVLLVNFRTRGVSKAEQGDKLIGSFKEMSKRTT